MPRWRITSRPWPRSVPIDPLEFSPNNINNQREKTYAAYGVLRFGADDWGVPFDGNIGVRVVRTEVTSDGVRTGTDIEGGGLLPVNVEQSYTDVLPSLNLRWMFTDQLQLRFAASKGISRPGFDKLNPNLSLSAADAGGGVTRRTGSAGNPNLKPMEATQFDTSLEWYFGQGSMMYGTAFYKKVDGFIANAVFNEVYAGENWEIDRPGPLEGQARGFHARPGLDVGARRQAGLAHAPGRCPGRGGPAGPAR